MGLFWLGFRKTTVLIILAFNVINRCSFTISRCETSVQERRASDGKHAGTKEQKLALTADLDDQSGGHLREQIIKGNSGGSDDPNWPDGRILMLVVSTHDGYLTAIELRLDRPTKEDESCVKLRKLWRTKLIRGQAAVYDGTSSSPTLSVDGEPRRLLPSLQGGLFAMYEGNVEALPFTADSILSSNVRFSENLTAIGTKASEIVNVDILRGTVLFRTDLSDDAAAAPHSCKVSQDMYLGLASKSHFLSVAGGTGPEVLHRVGDGEVSTAVSCMVPSQTCAVAFKHVTRRIKAVDCSNARVEWRFSTVDITSLNGGCCEAAYGRLVGGLGMDRLPANIDELTGQLTFSLHDGSVCSAARFVSDAGKQCVKLNSSMVRAWVVIADVDGGEPACMQELDLVRLSYAASGRLKTRMEMERRAVLCGETAGEERLPGCKNKSSANPILYIGRAQHDQMYVQISDHDFRSMVQEAKRRVSEDQQYAQGVFSSEMFFSIFDAARGCGRKLAVVILHQRDESEKENKNADLVPIHGLPALNYDTTAGIFILASHEVLHCQNMPFSLTDSVLWAVVSGASLLCAFLSVLSTSVRSFLCSATPVLKFTQFVSNVSELALLLLLRLIIKLKSPREPSDVDHSDRVNDQLAKQGSHTSQQEALRWLSVRLTSGLLRSYQSRYETEYRHVGCLGKGGFGVVFEAVNRLDHRRVAIKRIKFNNTANTEILQEIRFLAQLAYPHVVYYHCAWYEVPPGGWQKEKDKVLLERSLSCQKDEEGATTTELLDKGSTQSADGESEKLDSFSASPFHGTSQAASPNGGGDSFQVVFSDKAQEDGCVVGRFDYWNADDLDGSSEMSESLADGVTPDADDCFLRHNGRDCSSTSSCSKTTQTNSRVDVWNNCRSADRSVNHKLTSKSGNGEYYSKNERNKMELTEISGLRQAYSSKRRKNLSRMGYLYFCMELCQPDTLREWLEAHNGSDRPMSDAMWYFVQICNGVRYIHACNLIHRDLKPSNIFFSLSDRSLVKIGDFGLMTYFKEPRDDARQRLDVINVATLNLSAHTGVKVAGTDLYISPEQYDSPRSRPDQSVDIYALGIILFEILYPFSTKMERVMTLRCLRDICTLRDERSEDESTVPFAGNKHAFPAYGRRELNSILNYQKSRSLEWSVVRWLLSRRPSQRPSANELLENPTFIELAHRYLDEERFDRTGWRRARCSSSSQTLPM